MPGSGEAGETPGQVKPIRLPLQEIYKRKTKSAKQRWAPDIQNHTQDWWIFSVRFILIILQNGVDTENEMRNSSASVKDHSFCDA